MGDLNPLAPVAFLADASFEVPSSDSASKSTRRFSGTAYGGGVVTDHPYFDRVAFDLATTTLQTPAPALYQHYSEPIGVIREASVGASIAIVGELFADIDEQAKRIADKADRGMPWQLSVGIFPGRVEEVAGGSSVVLNGQTFAGPLTVFRDNRIREVSFCPLGADHTTSAQVFSVIGGEQPADNQKEIHDMATIEQSEHDRIIAELNAKIAEKDAAMLALQTQFAAQAKERRVADVKALFADTNREFKDDAAAPYVGMSDESFAAVAKDLRAAAKVQLPAHLFTEQVAGGRGSEAPKTIDEIRAAARAYIAAQAKYGNDVSIADAVTFVTSQAA